MEVLVVFCNILPTWNKVIQFMCTVKIKYVLPISEMN
jgi:hypothetical protein